MKEKEERKNKRIYYSMGEVAEMFDVNPSLIRYWEAQFDILKPDRNRKGNRLFRPQDVENLKIIYYLVRQKGMTLEGANRRIRDNREGVNRDMEVIERLQTIRSLLEEIREELKITDDDIAIDVQHERMEEDFSVGEQSQKENDSTRRFVSDSFDLFVDSEQPIESDYIWELSEELAEEAKIEADVRETLEAMESQQTEQQENKPSAYEQSLFNNW